MLDAMIKKKFETRRRQSSKEKEIAGERKIGQKTLAKEIPVEKPSYRERNTQPKIDNGREVRENKNDDCCKKIDRDTADNSMQNRQYKNRQKNPPTQKPTESRENRPK